MSASMVYKLDTTIERALAMSHTTKVQLPTQDDQYIAIRKYGGKIHAAFGDGATIGRALCDYRLHGRIVVGECETSTLCERCVEMISHLAGNTFHPQKGR